jgi:hypothetical protein
LAVYCFTHLLNVRRKREEELKKCYDKKEKDKKKNKKNGSRFER